MTTYEYTDADGDTIKVQPINTIKVNGMGAAVYLQTSESGVYLPLDRIAAFIDAVRETARLVAHRDGVLPCADPDCGPCSFDRAIPPDEMAARTVRHVCDSCGGIDPDSCLFNRTTTAQES